MTNSTKKPSSTTSDWSFNFRSTNFNFYSDSDSDADSVNLDETRLLNDLDLSSREETVLYKPNPFSIAKINAASRIHGAGTGVVSRREPVKEKLSLKAKASQSNSKGNIIDGFKKQAERSQGQSQSINALRPGSVTSRCCAADEIVEGGAHAKSLTKAINCPSPVKTTISTKQRKSVPFRTLFPMSKTAIRPSRVQLSTARVSDAIDIGSRPPVGSSPALASVHEKLHHAVKFANAAAPCIPVCDSQSKPRSRQEQTHIPTQSQAASTPAPQILPHNDGHSHSFQDNDHRPEDDLVSSPVNAPNHETRQNLRLRALPTAAPTSPPSSHASMPKAALHTATGHDNQNNFPQAPQSALRLNNHNSRFRPQCGGPFSSPILPPFMQDNDNANARAVPRTLMPVPMPFSSPLKPSDPYIHTQSSASAGATPGSRAFASTCVLPSCAFDFASSFRAGLSRSGPGLQPQSQPSPQLQSKIGHFVKHDSQHKHSPQRQIRIGNVKQEEEHCVVSLEGMGGEHDKAHHGYMRPSPSWTTPHTNAASTIHTQALYAPPPNNPWITQEQGYPIDVDVDDYQEQNSSTRFLTNEATRQQSGSAPLFRYMQQCDSSDERDQKRVYDTQAWNYNNAHTQALKPRKRERLPSLPRTVSPSPSPAPLPRKRAQHHNDARRKPKVRNAKISNINTYAFAGSNRHEAQDEEWSTLPLKKAKTKMYASVSRPGI
ncbi:hypothetical protein L208DRAFT_1379118 [Tricholoma matsutake]|nr:hypothetical protein L208DRAFT_1379118 [Tricholoma matsutake 945]